MPIWLRKYTFNKLREYYEKQSEEVNKVSKRNTPLPKGPSIQSPTYTSKIKK